MSSNRGSQSPPPKKGVAKVVKPKKGYNSTDHRTWTNVQLKAECKARGLKVSGNKDALVDRLRIANETRDGAESDEDEDEDESDENNAVEVEKDAETEVEKVPAAESEPAMEASTSKVKSTTSKANKEFKVPGTRKATMTEPYIEQKPVQAPRKPAQGQTRIGPDGHPLLRKPKAGIEFGGKPVPKNGFKANPMPDSPATVPGLKYKRAEIERAKAYRKLLMKLVEQIMEDNGDDDQVFADVVNHLGKARNELSKIVQAEAIEDEPEEVEEDEGDHEVEEDDDDEEVQENVEDPEDGDFSDGSRKRVRVDEDEEEGYGEDVDSPPSKRGRGLRSSEESEEE